VLTERGRIVDRTAGLPPRPLLPPAALATVRRGLPASLDGRKVFGQPVRLLAVPVHAQGQRLIVVVGQSLAERNQALSELTSVLGVGAPFALLLASAAGFLLIGSSLRPVEAMRRRAAEISASDLDGRLPPTGGNDALGRLGSTLNEMLERIQVSVGRERTFVSDASHELRTPLAMVRTELELMARERPAGPALQRSVRSAIEEVDRLTRLADDLLLLARADDGQSALRAERVSAGALLDAAARRARGGPLPSGLEIAVEDPGQAFVIADRDRVAQALDNLLGNAARYARSTIHLSARERNGLVEPHVRDDGPGFPAAFLPHAWERFARADSGRTEEGTGLGLAIVRTIAELHHGDARAENAAAGGADIWIALPRASAS
jgi:two-component system OmpR family sensor kinase